jgi:hypothetical protein
VVNVEPVGDEVAQVGAAAPVAPVAGRCRWCCGGSSKRRDGTRRGRPARSRSEQEPSLLWTELAGGCVSLSTCGVPRAHCTRTSPEPRPRRTR